MSNHFASASIFGRTRQTSGRSLSIRGSGRPLQLYCMQMRYVFGTTKRFIKNPKGGKPIPILIMTTGRSKSHARLPLGFLSTAPQRTKVPWVTCPARINSISRPLPISSRGGASTSITVMKLVVLRPSTLTSPAVRWRFITDARFTSRTPTEAIVPGGCTRSSSLRMAVLVGILDILPSIAWSYRSARPYVGRSPRWHGPYLAVGFPTRRPFQTRCDRVGLAGRRRRHERNSNTRCSR